MLNVVAICGNGMGTSMIIKIKVETILRKLNIQAKVTALSVGEASGAASSADIIICSKHLVDNLPKSNAKVVSLLNLMDEKEIELGLSKVL